MFLADMDENPDKDTEPHVQQLFIGSYRETGMGGASHRWAWGSVCPR